MPKLRHAIQYNFALFLTNIVALIILNAILKLFALQSKHFFPLEYFSNFVTFLRLKSEKLAYLLRKPGEFNENYGDHVEKTNFHEKFS